MDKREAIKIFIKRYPALFNLDPFPNETFKKTKREFFTNTAKISPPKDSEIAGEILEALIISEKVKNEKDLDKIFSLPFFRDKMSNKSFYYEKLRIKEGHKEPILDISKLENSEYVEQVTQEIKKQVESEVISTKQNELSKLDEEIQKRKDELEDIDSILFRENVPMPEEEIKNEQPTSYRPWWDELGLRDDPFFPLEGLSNISSKLWEQVVCKTEIFVKYEQMIDVSPRELFKNTVIYGQFGSGKTTFFDYINPKLYNNKIYPIYVQLGGEFEVRELIFEFRRQLNSDLSRLYAVLTGLTSERLETLDDELLLLSYSKT